ncbi:MAG: UPF0175 family protein, partial [Planktothrix sp.]
SGMAAALIGVDRVTFLLKLKDYGIPMIDFTEEELLSDARKCLTRKESIQQMINQGIRLSTTVIEFALKQAGENN